MTPMAQIRLSWKMTAASGLVIAAAAGLLLWTLSRQHYAYALIEAGIVGANVALILWQAKLRRILNRLL